MSTNTIPAQDSTDNSQSLDGKDRSGSTSSALDVVGSIFSSMGNSAIISSPSVLLAARKWRRFQERSINSRLSELKVGKRQRDLEVEREVNQLVARKIPLEMLTKEWFQSESLSLDSRIYLVEKLVPTLVLGVEKLLNEVRKRDLVDTLEPCPAFNPINFLAQFLMRNNPRYSNLSHTSPYARSLKSLLEELKRDAYNQEENRLAKLKAEAKKRREERRRNDRMNFLAKRGRPEALQEMFVEWTEERNGVIALSLVQSALKSYLEYARNLPPDVQSESMMSLQVEEIDITGRMMGMREFVEYVGKNTAKLGEESFTSFLKHMSNLAQEYRLSAEIETIRTLLANLFIACDHGGSGLLDRQRVLKLLQSFYDNCKDPTIKTSLRNPRKWPVVEIDEEEEEGGDEENSELFKGTMFVDSEAQDDGREIVQQSDEKESETAFNSVEDKSSDKNVTEQVENKDSTIIKQPGATAEDSEVAQNNSNQPIGKEQENDMVISNKTSEEDHKAEQVFSSQLEVKPNVRQPPVSAELEKEIQDIIESISGSEYTESPNKSRAQSITTGSVFDPHCLNQVQFCNLVIKFLGESPQRPAVETVVRYLRVGYRETEEEKMERLARARLEARSAKRRQLVDQLFDIWDIDGSGFLELSEIEVVLLKWREEGVHSFEAARDVFEEAYSRTSRKAFHKLIRKVVDSFPDEDCFESLVAFLTTSVERSFEERKRGEFRQRLLLAIDNAAQTSGALLDPVFRTAFQGLAKDAELHGRNKRISTYVAMLERNDDTKNANRGASHLRYVACAQDDINFVLNKKLYRDMSNVSFAAVDSGKPIHVPRVLNHGGVHLWNSSRKEEGIEGSFIVLPLKDHDKQVVGILCVDTMNDPHEKSIFVTHEISFFQGVAKALSAAIQFVDMRRKTIKIAESAVSWILRRSPNVHEVNIYLVEPGLKASDGLVLRRMVTIAHNNVQKHFEKPPRLERKDNLFRDYLFKCIDTSETLTADAYGERHLAFPLRDADGITVAIVDISIGNLRQLPPHESKEIHRMLKLLAIAHKEVTREVAGEEKNMVLKVEQEHEEQRIDVLFDRIMLQDLRDNVGRLDARAFAEIKSYKDPPKIVHDILKAVMGIYFSSRQIDDEVEEKFEEWTSCKQLVNNDLVAWISTFDPTAGENLAVDGERLAEHLSSVPPGAVAKHGSLPAQHLFNWAFVCLSLIEHTAKMRETRVQAGSFNQRSDDDAHGEQSTRTRSNSIASALSK